jgi:hypothetical protein
MCCDPAASRPAIRHLVQSDEGTTTLSRKRRGSILLGSFRSNMTVGVAVLVGITGLSYVLAGAAAQPGDAKSAVDFTPDRKLKQPVGYRKWVYVGTPVTPRSQGGEAPFPEFHAVSMDPETPLYLCDGRLPILTPPLQDSPQSKTFVSPSPPRFVTGRQLGTGSGCSPHPAARPIPLSRFGDRTSWIAANFSECSEPPGSSP